MSKGKARHMFPGGNTSLGFFSFYDQIISLEDEANLTIIKGGPGTGKSTFMRKIGETMIKRGFDIEFLHCSSDNNSLDGVHIPALGAAYIDGTAPHVVDPKLPGAADSILNFGEYWDAEGIRKHKRDISAVSAEIKECFARAYKYLKGAALIYDDSKEKYEKALNSYELKLLVSKLTGEIFKDKRTKEMYKNKTGQQRSMFASAITPGGFYNYLDSILKDNKIFELKCNMGTCEAAIIEKIKDNALEQGFYTEVFYCPLNPFKPEHIVIPELCAAVTTSNRYHSSNLEKYMVHDITDLYFPEKVSDFSEFLAENDAEADRLMRIALQSIRRAKTLHDELESYYIPYINFKAVNELLERNLDMLLNK